MLIFYLVNPFNSVVPLIKFCMYLTGLTVKWIFFENFSTCIELKSNTIRAQSHHSPICQTLQCREPFRATHWGRQQELPSPSSGMLIRWIIDYGVITALPQRRGSGNSHANILRIEFALYLLNVIRSALRRPLAFFFLIYPELASGVWMGKGRESNRKGLQKGFWQEFDAEVAIM